MIYYGIADCFLFDNAMAQKHNRFVARGLIKFESESMESLVELLTKTETADVKKAVKGYKNIEQENKPKFSDHMKLSMSPKYIVKYTKKDSYLTILDKKKFHNE